MRVEQTGKIWNIHDSPYANKTIMPEKDRLKF